VVEFEDVCEGVVDVGNCDVGVCVGDVECVFVLD